MQDRDWDLFAVLVEQLVREKSSDWRVDARKIEEAMRRRLPLDVWATFVGWLEGLGEGDA